MSLVVLGLSHHGAPLSLLESVALDPEARTALETAVLRSEHVTEAVVLSTCNRTEVYAECLTFHGALADITTALAQACTVDRNDLQPHLFVHYEERGIAHVFSVAAGLDSMAVGEAQILGQVRRSLARAQRPGPVGPALNTVLQQALRVAKRVHTETSIDLVSGSLVQAGLTRAEAELGGLGDLSVLVVGAGGMGALAATTVARAGARTVVVANRNHDRARSVAERVGGSALPLSGLAEALADADVVISSTGAPSRVVLADDVRAALTARD
jgi:glutamyl-tRNA reductase